MSSGRLPRKHVSEESEMAGSVNKVILIGNLGRDPEVRRLPSGDAVVSFSVATSESWKDKNSGERKDTDVVLQRFRGELTLLDGRGQGGGAEFGEEGGQISRGGDVGRGSQAD